MTTQEISAIVMRYPQERRFALAAMQDMQRVFSYIPRDGLELLAAHLCCPVAELYSMVTFYKALSLRPRGKHIIKLCNGTACHIRGAVNLKQLVGDFLGIEAGETTQDGQFTLEIVNCLGACASSPVIMIDDTFYGNVTAEQIPEILGTYREGEAK